MESAYNTFLGILPTLIFISNLYEIIPNIYLKNLALVTVLLTQCVFRFRCFFTWKSLIDLGFVT